MVDRELGEVKVQYIEQPICEIQFKSSISVKRHKVSPVLFHLLLLFLGSVLHVQRKNEIYEGDDNSDKDHVWNNSVGQRKGPYQKATNQSRKEVAHIFEQLEMNTHCLSLSHWALRRDLIYYYNYDATTSNGEAFF